MIYSLNSIKLYHGILSFENYNYFFLFTLCDSKSTQVSRTHLSILADLNYVVVWIVSTHPLLYKSSTSFNNPSLTVPRAQTTIVINTSFMSTFFHFPCKIKVFILLFAFFPAPDTYLSFNILSARTAKSKILHVLFRCCLSEGLVVRPRLGDTFVCQNPIGVCVSYSPGQMLGCGHNFCLYSQI